MEKVSFALAKEFSKKVDTTLITWGKSQKYLLLVIVIFLIKSLYLIPTKKITHVHLGDALLSPLGLLIKVLFKIKVTTTICGLDMTYKLSLYQFIIPKCVKRLDKIIPISDSTLEECIKRGVPREKCKVIHCGVYPKEFQLKTRRRDLEKIINRKLDGKKVIITVGRLVQRKGVFWFIENVFSKLDKQFVYLIIGEGSDKRRVEYLIQALGFQNRIFLLGKVSTQELKIIYNTSDLFIMPNIKVDNDIEGFGIVAIEAGSTGLPMVTSNIDGIPNAIMKGSHIKTPPFDAAKMNKNIKRAIGLKRNVKNFNNRKFDWTILSSKYLYTFEN
ncbi:glycosyltransferase family 4 protein [Candidatus Daviesbacteria bacterium]|nr:glycosyltransferase family 4 protein [Candidatus Daviesbacteria bacterium]